MENLRKYGKAPFSIVVVHGGPGAAGEMAPVAQELKASGGILLDMCRMDKIKAIQIEDNYVIVEPGVICGDLNKILDEKNYFFPPDLARFQEK